MKTLNKPFSNIKYIFAFVFIMFICIFLNNTFSYADTHKLNYNDVFVEDEDNPGDWMPTDPAKTSWRQLSPNNQDFDKIIIVSDPEVDGEELIIPSTFENLKNHTTVHVYIKGSAFNNGAHTNIKFENTGGEEIKVEGNSLSGLFGDCGVLTKVEGLNNIDLSGVTDVSNMFKDCETLESVDFTGTNFGNITNASGMFSGCFPEDEDATYTVNLDALNFSNCTDVSEMFYESNVTTLSFNGLDFSSVTNAENMFNDCANLKYLELPCEKMGNITNAKNMFNGCGNILYLDLSAWDISKLTDAAVEGMFDFGVEHTSLRDPKGLQYIDMPKNTNGIKIDLTKVIAGQETGEEEEEEPEEDDDDEEDGSSVKPRAIKNCLYDVDYNEYKSLPKTTKSVRLYTYGDLRFISPFTVSYYDDRYYFLNTDGKVYTTDPTVTDYENHTDVLFAHLDRKIVLPDGKYSSADPDETGLSEYRIVSDKSLLDIGKNTVTFTYAETDGSLTETYTSDFYLLEMVGDPIFNGIRAKSKVTEVPVGLSLPKSSVSCDELYKNNYTDGVDTFKLDSYKPFRVEIDDSGFVTFNQYDYVTLHNNKIERAGTGNIVNVEYDYIEETEVEGAVPKHYHATAELNITGLDGYELNSISANILCSYFLEGRKIDQEREVELTGEFVGTGGTIYFQLSEDDYKIIPNPPDTPGKSVPFKIIATYKDVTKELNFNMWVLPLVSKTLNSLYARYTGTHIVEGFSVVKNRIKVTAKYRGKWQDGDTVVENVYFTSELEPSEFDIDPVKAPSITKSQNMTVTCSHTYGPDTAFATVEIFEIALEDISDLVFKGIKAECSQDIMIVDTTVNVYDYFTILGKYDVTYRIEGEEPVTETVYDAIHNEGMDDGGDKKVTVSPKKVLKDKNTYTVTYVHTDANSYTDTVEITGVEGILKSISAVYTGDPIPVGLEIYKNDIKVTAIFVPKDDPDSGIEIKQKIVSDDIRITPKTVALGINIVYVYYEHNGIEKWTTVEIEGILAVLQGISAEWDGTMSIEGFPIDTDIFNVSGEFKAVETGIVYTRHHLKGFTIDPTIAVAGDNLITITYKYSGVTKKCTVLIKAIALKDIHDLTLNYIVATYDDDIMLVGDKIKPEKMHIKANWTVEYYETDASGNRIVDDSGHYVLKKTTASTGVNTGYDYDPKKITHEGNNEITVTYTHEGTFDGVFKSQTKDTTFNVLGVDGTLKSIKASYIGDPVPVGLEVNKKDIIVIGTFDVTIAGENLTLDMSIDSDDIMITPKRMALGTNNVTIFYTHKGITKTTIVEVEGISETLVNLYASWDGTMSIEGFPIDKKIFNVTGEFKAGSGAIYTISNLKDFTVSPITATAGDNIVTILYKYGGSVKTCTVVIKAIPLKDIYDATLNGINPYYDDDIVLLNDPIVADKMYIEALWTVKYYETDELGNKITGDDGKYIIQSVNTTTMVTTGYDYTPKKITHEGINEINVTYTHEGTFNGTHKKQTKSNTFNVYGIDATLKSLKATYIGDDIPAGLEVDKRDVFVTASFSAKVGGKNIIFQKDIYKDDYRMSPKKVMLGKNIITILYEYKGIVKTATIEVTGVDAVLLGISAIWDGTPSIESYSIDTDTINVIGEFRLKKGSKTYTIDHLQGFYIDPAIAMAGNNVVTVTYKYNDTTKTCQVIIWAIALNDIKNMKLNFITASYDDDVALLNDSIRPEKIHVKANWDVEYYLTDKDGNRVKDSGGREITNTTVASTAIPSGFSYNPERIVKLGNNMIIVSYTWRGNTKTDDFNVFGVDGTLKSINAVYTGGKVPEDTRINTRYISVVGKFATDYGDITKDIDIDKCTVSPMIMRLGDNIVTISYTHKGITKMTSIVVTGVKATLVKIKATYTGGKVIKNMDIDKSKIIVAATFVTEEGKDFVSIPLENDEFMIDPDIVKEVGENTIYVYYTYHNVTKSDSIVIIGVQGTLTGINTVYNGGNEIAKGTVINKDTFKVTANYIDDEGTSQSAGPVASECLYVFPMTINEGVTPVNIYFVDGENYGKSTFDITGYNAELLAINADYSGLDVPVGTRFNKSDINVIAMYKYKSGDKVTDVGRFAQKLSPENFKINSDTIGNTGNNTYNISYIYKDIKKEASITVKGVNADLKKISSRYTGTPIFSKEDFYRGNIITKATYFGNNGTVFIIKLPIDAIETDIPSGNILTGIQGFFTRLMSNNEEKSTEITYTVNGKTATDSIKFDIANVSNKNIAGINTVYTDMRPVKSNEGIVKEAILADAMYNVTYKGNKNSIVFIHIKNPDTFSLLSEPNESEGYLDTTASYTDNDTVSSYIFVNYSPDGLGPDEPKPTEPEEEEIVIDPNLTILIARRKLYYNHRQYKYAEDFGIRVKYKDKIYEGKDIVLKVKKCKNVGIGRVHVQRIKGQNGNPLEASSKSNLKKSPWIEYNILPVPVTHVINSKSDYITNGDIIPKFKNDKFKGVKGVFKLNYRKKGGTIHKVKAYKIPKKDMSINGNVITFKHNYEGTAYIDMTSGIVTLSENSISENKVS